MTNTLYPRGKGRNILIIKTKDITLRIPAVVKPEMFCLKATCGVLELSKHYEAVFLRFTLQFASNGMKDDGLLGCEECRFQDFWMPFYMKTPRGTFKTQKYSNNNNNIWYAFSHINIFTSLIDCSDQQLASLLTCSVKCFIQHYLYIFPKSATIRQLIPPWFFLTANSHLTLQ